MSVPTPVLPANLTPQNCVSSRIVVREALTSDIDRLVEMGERFVADSPYGRLFPVNPDRVLRMVSLVLNNGVAFVAEVVDDAGAALGLVGMIGLFPNAHPLAGGLWFDEIAWWVEPAWRSKGVGPRLVEAAEQWAERRGADLVRFASPAGSMVGKYLLERRGCLEVETSYIKVFRPLTPAGL